MRAGRGRVGTQGSPRLLQRWAVAILKFLTPVHEEVFIALGLTNGAAGPDYRIGVPFLARPSTSPFK